jgi:hypothetical protein
VSTRRAPIESGIRRLQAWDLDSDTPSTRFPSACGVSRRDAARRTITRSSYGIAAPAWQALDERGAGGCQRLAFRARATFMKSMAKMGTTEASATAIQSRSPSGRVLNTRWSAGT